MSVSVASCHTELLTPALCSAHEADVACCVSQGSRPFATTTVVPESAAVTNIFALLATAMLAVELSTDAPPKVMVTAVLMDVLDARLAVASFAIIGDAARLPVALSAAPPSLNVSPEAASAELALSAESAAWVRLGAADRLPDAAREASPTFAAIVGAALTVELAVRLDAATWVRLDAALMDVLAVRLDKPRRASVEA